MQERTGPPARPKVSMKFSLGRFAPVLRALTVMGSASFGSCTVATSIGEMTWEATGVGVGIGVFVLVGSWFLYRAWFIDH